MKKIIVLTGLLFLTTLVSFSQYAYIGSGINTTTTYTPYKGIWHDAKFQFIIEASELVSAGVNAGDDLTSLGFEVSSVASSQAYSGFTISIAHTSNTNFTSVAFLSPVFTNVYSSNYTVSSTGWNDHIFTTNFTWNGTDNIVIQVCYDNTSFTSSDAVYYSSTSDDKTCYEYADNASGCSLSAYATTVNRPNMRIAHSGGTVNNFTVDISSTTPAASTGDTINLCQGQSVAFNASASGTYTAPITYTWTFGDGTNATGSSVSHTFNNEGGYIITLYGRDNTGTLSDNTERYYIRVSTTPDFSSTYTTATNDEICLGQTIDLFGDVEPVTIETNVENEVAGTTFLPDGTGASYTSTITHTTFGSSQTITSVNDIISVCLNMEHSYAGDLTIALSCPDGSQILLVDHNTEINLDWEFIGEPVDLDCVNSPSDPNCATAGVGYDYCWLPTSTNGTWDDIGASPPLYSFTDAIGTVYTDHEHIAAGDYQAMGSFSNLVGCPLNGDWTITVTDHLGIDNGYIFNWQLNFDPSILPDFPYTDTYTELDPSAQWSVNPGSNLSTTNGDATHTPGSAGTYDYLFEITDNYGCSYDTTITVEAYAPATVDAGGNATICESSDYTLSGANMGGGATSVSWSTGSGDGTFDNTNSVNPTYTPGTGDISNGSVTLTITTNDPTGPCNSSTDNMTLSIDESPTVSAGSGSTICSDETFTITGSSMGSGTAGINWTTSGDGNFDNASNLYPVYTPGTNDIANGSVSLTLTGNSSLGVCSDATSSITLTINDAATVSAGSNATICEGATYTFSGATFGGGAVSATWSTTGDGSFDNNSSLTATYTPGSNDISNGTVILTLTTDDPAGSCNAVSDNLTLTINPLDDAGFSYSQGTYCSTGSDPIPTVNTGGGTFSGPAGLSISSTTGTIDLSASTVGGPYTVTYTTSGACSESNTFNVTITSGFDAEFYYNEPFCSSESNPIPQHNTGSNGIYSGSPAGLIFVNTGSGEIDLTNSTPGTYTVTNLIAAAGGCSQATHSESVSVYLAALVSAGSDASICEGSTYQLSTASTGGSTMNVNWLSDGTGSFDSNTLLNPTYTPSSQDISNGSVTLTIISNDPTGPCDPDTSSMILTIYPAATISAGTNATICEGEIYNLNGSFGGGATDITWTTGGDGNFNDPTSSTAVYTPGTNDISNGSVVLTITTNDPTGPCDSISDNITLTINPIPVVEAGNNITICSDDTYTLSGSVSGGASGGSWGTSGDGVFDDENILTPIYTPGPNDISNGSVTLTLTSDPPSGPCPAVSDNLTITIDPAATINAGINQTICSNETVTLSATIGGGASTVNWSSSGDGAFDDSTSVTPIYTPGTNDISSGTVNLTVTTDNPSGPCATVSDNLNITINPNPTISATGSGNDTICEGQTYALSASIGGGASSLTWENGSGDGSFDFPNNINAIYTPGPNDIANGSVNISVTTDDPTGPCNAASNNLTLIINPTAVIDSAITTNVSSCLAPNGTIEIYASGGTSPLNYSYDNGTSSQYNASSSTFINLDVGSYNITVSDNNACMSTSQVTIGSTSGPSIDSVITTDVTCFGDTGGQITIYSTGAVLYSINNGNNYVSSNTFSNLPAGMYNIVVEDPGKCHDIMDSVVIAQADSIEITTNITDEYCNFNNGQIEINVAGGTGSASSFQYSIDSTGSFQNSNIFTNLNEDTYYIIVKDSLGCENILYNQKINATPVVTIDSVFYSMPLCYGHNNGTITINASNNPYEYSVDNGSNFDTLNIFDSLYAGQYTVIVKDTGTCYDTTQITITEPDSLSLSMSHTDATCGANDGQAVVSVTGGTLPYTYTWTNNLSTDDTLLNVPYGSYTVTITDNNACIDSLNVSIGNQGGAIISIDSTANLSCFESDDGHIYISISNGTPDFTYIWSTGDTTVTSQITDSLSGLPEGSYTVTVIDLNGCIADTSISITQPQPLNVVGLKQNVDCYGNATGAINTTVNGGTPPYNYLWNNNDTTNSLTNLTAGNYSLTVSDSNNCFVEIPLIGIFQPDSLYIDQETINNINCYNDSTGSIQISITGGVSPYEYYWNNGDTINQITELKQGSYQITITDSNNCVFIDSFTVNQPTQLILTDSVYYENHLGVINIDVSGGTQPYKYNWSNKETTANISGLVSGKYNITVTDFNDCVITDSTTIEIPFLIPSIITPNGDDYNDTWMITNIASYEQVTIDIFNRWGDLVYQFDGTGMEYQQKEKQWDGSYEGNELPTGAYVYIINLHNDKDPFTGIVSIKK